MSTSRIEKSAMLAGPKAVESAGEQKEKDREGVLGNIHVTAWVDSHWRQIEPLQLAIFLQLHRVGWTAGQHPSWFERVESWHDCNGGQIDYRQACSPMVSKGQAVPKD